MTTTHTFTLSLQVDDAAALHRAALAHLTRVDGLDDDEAFDLIGPADRPNIESCLDAILAPYSIPGCTIHSATMSAGSQRAMPKIGDIVEVHAPRVEGGRIYVEWVRVNVITLDGDGSVYAKVPGGSERRFAPGQWR